MRSSPLTFIIFSYTTERISNASNSSAMGKSGPFSWIKQAFGKGTQSEGPKLVTRQPSKNVVIARLPSRYIVDDDAAVSVAQTYGAY